MSLLNRLKIDHTPKPLQLSSHTAKRRLQKPNQTELIGSYRFDYDIIYADRIVKTNLAYAVQENATIEKEIVRLRGQKSSNRIAQITIDNEIEDLERRIKINIEQEQKYLAGSPSILKEYLKCDKPTPVEIGKSLVVMTEGDIKRLHLIEKWIQFARDFIPVYIIREMSLTTDCVDCYLKLIDEDGILICPKCRINYGPAGDENESKIMGSQIAPRKKNYDLVANLRKTFYRIQGISFDNKLPYDEIKAKFDLYCQQTNTSPHKLTRDKFIDLLKVYNFIENYADVNLIMHLYINTELPDYSKYEERVMSRYTSFIEIYPNIKKTRTSALNGQYCIHKLLQLEGCETNPSDFKMTKGSDTLEEYERIWEDGCKLLGWPFIKSF